MQCLAVIVLPKGTASALGVREMALKTGISSGHNARIVMGFTSIETKLPDLSEISTR